MERGERHSRRSIRLRGYESAKRVNDLRSTPGAQLWQRNYQERVIRNSLSLHALRCYIANNPVLWKP